MTGTAVTSSAVAADRILTETAVRRLVHTWYEALSRHLPVEELSALLAPAGLVLRLPGATLRGHDEVAVWHEKAVSTYFDETYELADLTIRLISPLHADVSAQLRWQARRWQPPAAHSDWLGYEYRQDLSVVLREGTPRIRTCTVRGMAPMPGSAAF